MSIEIILSPARELLDSIKMVRNIGMLEAAQHAANHESPRTAKLFDRRQD